MKKKGKPSLFKRFFSGGIRHKLFIQVSLMICLFALLIMLTNIFFLEIYYTASERQLLRQQTKYIDSLNITDYSRAALQLEQVEKLNNSMIVIYRPIGSQAFVMYHTNMDFSTGIRDINDLSYAVNTDVIDRRQNSDGSIYETQKDRRMSVTYLVCKKQLTNGDVLDIRVIKNSVRKNVQLSNQFMLFITGFSLLGLLLWAYWYAKKFTHPIEEMNRITGAIRNFDFQRKCKINSEDELGQLAGSINQLSDSLGNALEDLQSKNAQLQAEIDRKQKMEQARKEFFSNASHELKTPLSIIMGYAEGLQLNTDDPEKQRVYADVIHQEAQKMNKLVHSLLELSRMESEQTVLQAEELDIGAFAADVVQKYAPIFRDEEVTLEQDIASGIFCAADATKLEQALTNYLNNALFHAEGPRIVRVTGEVREENYRITVYNTGQQIAREELEDIWHGFYRSDKARNRQDERYGLGLSIVRAIIQMHKGAYGVNNIEDGVEFWFELPVIRHL